MEVNLSQVGLKQQSGAYCIHQAFVCTLFFRGAAHQDGLAGHFTGEHLIDTVDGNFRKLLL